MNQTFNFFLNIIYGNNYEISIDIILAPRDELTIDNAYMFKNKSPAHSFEWSSSRFYHTNVDFDLLSCFFHSRIRFSRIFLSIVWFWNWYFVRKTDGSIGNPKLATLDLMINYTYNKLLNKLSNSTDSSENIECIWLILHDNLLLIQSLCVF